LPADIKGKLLSVEYFYAVASHPLSFSFGIINSAHVILS